MRVDSYDSYREVGFFDPETGALRKANRSEADISGEDLRGHFSCAGGVVTVFYRQGDSLYLRLADRNWSAEPWLVTWSKEGSVSCLMVQDGAGFRAKIQYEVQARQPYDATAFAEDEDWDFGLYVVNVLNSQERRARIYC